MGTSAVGEMNIILSANAASFSAGIDQAQRQLDKLAGRSKTTSRTMVSDLQATSGGLRLLEGGMTNSLRAAERFLSMLPGVGAAMKAAFPVVGAIAFGAILVRVGKELYDFIKTASEAPEKLQLSLGALGNSQRMAGDQLELANDKLREQIAILEGKPVNNAALALDEAKLASDRLADSLEKSASRLQEVLAADKITLVQQALSGIAGHPEKSTASAEDELKKSQNATTVLGYQLSIATANGDMAAVAALTAQIKRAQEAELALDRQRLSENQRQSAKPQGYLDQLSTFFQPVTVGNEAGIDTSGIQGVYLADQARIIADQKEQQRDTDSAKLTAQADALEKGKAFAAEQKRLAEQEVQQWRQQLNDLKASQDTTILQEAQFWLQRAETVKAGGVAYRAAMDEANKSIADMRRESAKALQELGGLSGGPEQASDTTAQAQARMHAEAYLSTVGNVSDDSALREQAKQVAEHLRDLGEETALQKQQAAAIAETALQMAVATGQMNKLDAAQAQAALHAQEYADAVEGLQRMQAGLDADVKSGALTPVEASLRQDQINKQTTQLQGQRSIQVLEDQQAISDQTFGGASKEALDRMVSDWEDMATKVASTLVQTIGSFNDDIAKLLVGEGGHNRQQIGAMFGRTFRSAGEGLIHTGLQGAESSVLHRFGLGGGKPTGTPGDPLYTVVTNLGGGAGGAGNPVSAVAGDLASRIPGGAPAAQIAGDLFGGGRPGGGTLTSMPQFPVLPGLTLPNVTGPAADNGAAGSGIADLIASPLFPSLPATASSNVTGPSAGDNAAPSGIANLPLFPSLPPAALPNVVSGAQGGPAVPSVMNAPTAPGTAQARDLINVLGGALSSTAGKAASVAPPGTSSLPSEDPDGTDGAGTNGVGNANKAYTMITPGKPSLLDSILADTIQQAGKIGGQLVAGGMANNANANSQSGSGDSDSDSLFAGGGQVFGPGSGTSDSIPAMLSHGEFVTNARSTAKHLPLLHQINNDALHFADGGMVGSDILDNYPSLVGDTHLGSRASAAPQIMPSPSSVGGDTYHSYTIDARGATDPAQTQAAVQRAMRQYGPQMVSASLAAAKNQQMRKPSTAR